MFSWLLKVAPISLRMPISLWIKYALVALLQVNSVRIFAETVYPGIYTTTNTPLPSWIIKGLSRYKTVKVSKMNVIY